MNSSEQAQKGFKTFLLTLSVSLILFSVIYYVLTNSAQSEDVSAGVESEEVLVSDKSERSKEVFGELASQHMEVPRKAVLAGADGTVVGETPETTESTTTVPVTGSFSITVGLVTSLLIFMVGMFVIYKDPRKLALTGFEKEMLKDLD